MSILDKITEQVSFLFHDAGDKHFRLQSAGMSAITVDVIDNETVSMQSDVTSFPREGLENMGDNIQQKPVELTFDCFVSNQPIRGLIDGVTDIADHALSGKKRTSLVFNALWDAWQAKQLFTLTTQRKVYSNMAITGIQVVQTPDIGDAITFTLNVRKINIVSSATAKVPAGMGIQGNQIGSANQKAGAGVNAGQNANGKGDSSSIYDKLKAGAGKSVIVNLGQKAGIIE
ncbi:phage baseplate protein [Pantoea sp. ME81]|uniref:phage baseplate protein n=1 Tax=Pantoea sp. ME81 TaxID=2743935 RepID=UPI0015F3C608|nr:hypothetical protein [Pantoea sp. ME81]